MTESQSHPATPATTKYDPPSGTRRTDSHLKSMDDYDRMYRLSMENPREFWADMAVKHLVWHRPFSTVLSGGFEKGNVAWFADGQINVSQNCIDRHAHATPDRTAIIYEPDEPGHAQKISFAQLLDKVCRVANVLKARGVGKGDCVAIYMPMVPEAAFAMLACSRIGAIHSVVFAGFSAEALRDRINDAQCKLLITADQGKRGSKTIHLKRIVDEALSDCPSIQHCLVFRRTGDLDVSMHVPRDLWWHDEVAKHRPVCPPEVMNAEDPLFYLYTSGSTGKPKGLMHTTAGYLLQTTVSLKYCFDVHPGDVYCCTADVGWITGHSFIVYGPLSLGTTTVMFESVPTYPEPDRYWKMVAQHKVTHFYTAPTAIRALKRLGDEWVTKNEMPTLRMLGTVGEPINPEAWEWYYRVVGRGKCSLVDTYWQTETGAFMIAPYSSVTPMKPGSASFPQFGVAPVILDADSGKVLEGNDVTGVLAISKPWPSMARTVYGDHERYMNTYFGAYKGYYFTGDGATRDKDGFYWIRGRVDDVLNVSGHRLSTSEIESALVLHPGCAEAAVIGAPDDITGQAVVAFCLMKKGVLPAHSDTTYAQVETTLQKELVMSVRKHIGPLATPKRVIIVDDLPKTRSGKIMRRILRKIVCQETKPEQLGDLSTLADPNVIQVLIAKVNA